MACLRAHCIQNPAFSSDRAGTTPSPQRFWFSSPPPRCSLPGRPAPVAPRLDEPCSRTPPREVALGQQQPVAPDVRDQPPAGSPQSLLCLGHAAAGSPRRGEMDAWIADGVMREGRQRIAIGLRDTYLGIPQPGYREALTSGVIEQADCHPGHVSQVVVPAVSDQRANRVERRKGHEPALRVQGVAAS
jgi:hypothetical protein